MKRLFGTGPSSFQQLEEGKEWSSNFVELMKTPKYKWSCITTVVFFFIIMFFSIVSSGEPPPGGSTPRPAPVQIPPPPPATPAPLPPPGIASLVTAEELLRHLSNLQRVAEENGGNRAMGTPGYARSSDYVTAQLDGMGLRVSWRQQNFTVAFNDLDKVAHPTLQLKGRTTEEFVFDTDFATLSNSGFGSLTGQLVPAEENGCNASHYAAVRAAVAGGGEAPVVALVARGACFFSEKMRLAQEAGAAAVCIYNNAVGLFKGTLGGAGNVQTNLPSLALTDVLGNHLRDLASQSEGITVALTVSGKYVSTNTHNIIAEVGEGDAESVVIAGAHLDSVEDGPGINDNGSGSSALLAMARALLGSVPSGQLVNRVRFCWWAAEERGLLGSRHYVEKLVESGADVNVALNLNFDMLASPNWAREVYNGSDPQNQAPETVNASTYIMNLFQRHFSEAGLTHKLVPFTGRSDYGAFLEKGIPAGGLATGAEVLKTAEERKLFGGLANAAYDPCYHQKCDDIDNAGGSVHEAMADAAAHVLYDLAMTQGLRTIISYPKKLPVNSKGGRRDLVDAGVAKKSLRLRLPSEGKFAAK